MTVCPVCEAPAQSRVCEVCGHAFASEAAGPTAEVAPVEGFEVSQRVEGPTATTPLPDFEPTRFEATAAPAPPVGPQDLDWERTRGPEVADVLAGGMEELESGREPPSQDRTPLLASVTCRYCRNVQAAGLLCERCGMRLPWRAKAAPAQPVLDADAL